MCPERRAVLAAVYSFFDAMETRDVEASERVLIPEGTFVSSRLADGEQQVRSFTNAEYVERLAERQDDVRETMNNPTVLIEGDIAIVWADYRFERNGELSHTGIDAFTLVRVDGEWKIAGGIYSVVPPKEE